jgi:hypothetical protein
MKKFGVPVAFRTKAPEGPGADLARYVDMRKAQNKVKRYCETKGLEVLTIRAATEAEVLHL